MFCYLIVTSGCFESIIDHTQKLGFLRELIKITFLAEHKTAV